MTPDIIKYRSGYKYQLAEDYRLGIELFPAAAICTEYIDLDPEGILTIRKGYAWDGPSGPTIDTRNTLRGSLVHDALYQLMRQGRLPQSVRLLADNIAHRIWREDGMSAWRAFLWRRELGKFAAAAADPKNMKTVQTAP